MNRWRIFVVLTALLALAWILLMPLVARRASLETLLAPFPLPRPPFPHGPWSGAERSGVGSLVGNLATLVRDFLAGSLVLFLLPERMRAMTFGARGGFRRLLRPFFVGLLIAVVLGAIALLSMLSFHTFPLPFLLAAVFFLQAWIGSVALAFALGEAWLSRAGWSTRRPLYALAYGTLLLFAATTIPYAGWVFLGVIWLTGAGVTLTTHFGSGSAWSLAPLMEDPAA